MSDDTGVDEEYLKWHDDQLRHMIRTTVVISLTGMTVLCCVLAIVLGFVGAIADKQVAGSVTWLLVAAFGLSVALARVLKGETVLH